LWVGSRVVDVDEAKVPAATEVDIISRKFLPSSEDDPDEFTIRPHPFFLIEADKAWDSGVDRVVLAHLYLGKGGEGLWGI